VNGDIKLTSAKILLSRGTTSVGNGLCFLNRDLRLRNIRNLVHFNHKEIESFMSQIQAEVLLFKVTKRTWGANGEENNLILYPAPKFRQLGVEGAHHAHLDHPERVIGHICNFLEYGPPRQLARL